MKSMWRPCVAEAAARGRSGQAWPRAGLVDEVDGRFGGAAETAAAGAALATYAIARTAPGVSVTAVRTVTMLAVFAVGLWVLALAADRPAARRAVLAVTMASVLVLLFAVPLARRTFALELPPVPVCAWGTGNEIGRHRRAHHLASRPGAARSDRRTRWRQGRTREGDPRVIEGSLQITGPLPVPSGAPRSDGLASRWAGSSRLAGKLGGRPAGDFMPRASRPRGEGGVDDLADDRAWCPRRAERCPAVRRSSARLTMAPAVLGDRRRDARCHARRPDRLPVIVQCDARHHDRRTARRGVAIDRADGVRERRFYTYDLLDNADRLKQRYPWEKPRSAIFTLVLLEFGDFPMMRRVLKGSKPARRSPWPRWLSAALAVAAAAGSLLTFHRPGGAARHRGDERVGARERLV